MKIKSAYIYELLIIICIEQTIACKLIGFFLLFLIRPEIQEPYRSANIAVYKMPQFMKKRKPKDVHKSVAYGKYHTVGSIIFHGYISLNRCPTEVMND